MSSNGTGHGHGDPANVDSGFSAAAQRRLRARRRRREYGFLRRRRDFFACLAHFMAILLRIFICATHAVIASCAHSKCPLDAAFVDNGTVIRRTSNSSCAQLHLNTTYWRPGAIGLVHGQYSVCLEIRRGENNRAILCKVVRNDKAADDRLRNEPRVCQCDTRCKYHGSSVTLVRTDEKRIVVHDVGPKARRPHAAPTRAVKVGRRSCGRSAAAKVRSSAHDHDCMSGATRNLKERRCHGVDGGGHARGL